MQMSKNVNNDVSMNTPIPGRSGFDRQKSDVTVYLHFRCRRMNLLFQRQHQAVSHITLLPSLSCLLYVLVFNVFFSVLDSESKKYLKNSILFANLCYSEYAMLIYQNSNLGVKTKAKPFQETFRNFPSFPYVSEPS